MSPMAERDLDGNKLFEPQTSLLIPFKSHTDALLAQLPLHHGISKQHFNLLLDILLDPSFSPEEINLRSATDIDVRISEHRRELAENRSHRSVNPFKSAAEKLGPAGMPSIVFDLLVDQFLVEMESFSHEADATPGALDEPNVSCTQERQADLRHMSIVHRSWTEPVQRALRRRVVLTSRCALRDFARSPACGTGVREFAYKIPKAETCTFFHETSVAREHWSTLASVVSRLTTLRFLCLGIESAHLADLSGLDLVLHAIGGLSTLEGLWLLSSRDHCPYLPQLCATISKLPNLRYLSIFNWTCPQRFGTSDTLELRGKIIELPPPPRLKALQLRDEYLTTPPAYLAWLFQPRDSYCLDTLDLQITFSRPLPISTFDPDAFGAHYSPRVDSTHLISALAPLLPALSSLAIKFFYLDTSSTASAAAHDTDLQVLLAQCTALRHVRLHRLRAGTSIDGIRMPSALLTAPLVLPPTLEELHMHYTHSAVNWRTQDQRLYGTLCAASLPRLQRVLVSTGDLGCMDIDGSKVNINTVNPAMDLPKTNELCTKLKVEFMRYDNVHLDQNVIDSLS